MTPASGPGPDPAAVDRVAAEIEAAFAHAPAPSDASLLHPLCRDDVDVAAYYGIPHWREVTAETLIREWAAPIAFSPTAFRFYLPAYLLWTLRNLDTVEYVAEATLRALDPGPRGVGHHDFLVSHFAEIDARQGATIVAALELVANASPDPEMGALAEAALVNHWYDRITKG